ncbi:MAG: T9SS type A sorting domain-containing protein [Candidatus Stahlbacteria bacterium]|nr:T9SS type A sorting domain-containing protein [Candidatus Stahlbacteria bacterium]
MKKVIGKIAIVVVLPALAFADYPLAYYGGPDDGHSVGLYDQGVPEPSRYAGGPDDGFASGLYDAGVPEPTRFAGGPDEGFASGLYDAGVPEPTKFAGGPDDGFASGLYDAGVPEPSRYAGGADDGYAFVGSADIPIAIILVSFTGIDSGGMVFLQWETEMEVNAVGFNLYRSPDKADYEKMVFVPARGSLSKYSWIDTTIDGGFTYWYKLLTLDDDKVETFHDPVSGPIPVNVAPFPKYFFLNQNYPNPFATTTYIKYGVPKATDVKFVVYNILGQRVAELINKRHKPGYYTLKFNPLEVKPLPSGVYFCRMETNKFISTKKLILMK